MITHYITIAIDGYSSCGKSTIAKGLARKLGYRYIDSGAMYRAVTLYFIEKGINDLSKVGGSDIHNLLQDINISFEINRETNLSEIFLNKKNVEGEIRSMDVSNYVSAVSALKFVREKISALQKEMGRGGGIVMDGRDIGTHIFPHAELKIFMTADENVRAQRRWSELKAKGHNISLEEVKKNIAMRDYEDTNRQYSPLRKAEDAIVLDNTLMTQEQQLRIVEQWALERINSKL